MAVTNEQVAALHAQLAGRTDEHRRLLQQLDRAEANVGYSALVAAAFYQAAERRFIRDGKVATRAEVIDFIASVRARSDESVDLIDPDIAEHMILQVLGLDAGSDAADIDHDVAFETQIVLMAALVGDAEFTEEELDDFMEKVRADADELTE